MSQPATVRGARLPGGPVLPWALGRKCMPRDGSRPLLSTRPGASLDALSPAGLCCARPCAGGRGREPGHRRPHTLPASRPAACRTRCHSPGQPPPPASHPLLLLWLISPHAACQLGTLEQKLRKRSKRSAPARPPARGRSAGGGGQRFQEGPQFPSSSRPCRGPVQGGMRHRWVTLAPSNASSPPPH